jgi:hypothetical protein
MDLVCFCALELCYGLHDLLELASVRSLVDIRTVYFICFYGSLIDSHLFFRMREDRALSVME